MVDHPPLDPKPRAGLFKPVEKLWVNLTSPAETIEATDDRQRAQILSALLVPMLIITLLGVFAGHLWGGTDDLLFVILFLGIAYSLSRTRHYVYGAVLTIFGLCIPSFAGLFLVPDPSNLRMASMLMWLVIPLMLGSIVLPSRVMAAVSAIIIAGIVTIAVWRQIGLVNYLDTLAYLSSLSLFLTIAAHIRQNEIVRRRKAEESLLTLSQAVEQSSTSVMITDTNGTIEYVNPRFSEISGYTADEVIGKTPRILQSGETPNINYTQLWETIAVGNIWQGDLCNKRKNGELYWEATSISSIKDATGKIKHYLAVKEDITDRKQAEAALQQYAAELEQRNQDLDAFAHTVAHDLKNPLSATIYNAKMLLTYRKELSKKKKERYLKLIHGKGLIMNTIIDELLFMAKVRKEEVESEPLDMSAIIAAVQFRLKEAIKATQATLNLPDSWPAALGYAPWIEEVWANYLDNALKYGGSPPVITLGASPVTNGVKFWIRDNGQGLTTEEQERLYSPFTQLEPSQAKGHGLGLSIVNRILEKLGGEVGVESLPEAGSMFWFTLPTTKSVPVTLVKHQESTFLNLSSTTSEVDDVIARLKMR